MELTLKMFDIGKEDLEIVNSLEEKYEFKKKLKRNQNLTRQSKKPSKIAGLLFLIII